jgi:spore maturation protein CgeB
VKILFIADFAHNFYGPSEYKSDGMLRDGFRAAGHDVLEFSYREYRANLGHEGMRSALFTATSVYKPDVIVVGYGDGLSKDDFITMREYSDGAPIAYWYGDAREPLEQWVIDLASESSLFLCTQGGHILKKYKEASGCKKVAFFPNLINPELYKPLDKIKGSIIFTGGNYGERVRAESVYALRTHFADRFQLYGWDHGSRIIGKDYTDAIGHSDFGLAVTAFHDRPKGQSSRTLEYMACGVCVLVKTVPGIEDLLGLDSCIYFDEPGEIPGLINKYDRISREIGENAVEWVNREYDYRIVSQYVLDELSGNLWGMYGDWVEVY